MIQPPNGLDEIKSVYGELVVAKLDGKPKIISPRYWEERNCILVHDFPCISPRPLYVNRIIEEPLRAALDLVAAGCPDYKIRTIGCFNPRPKRVNPHELSLHSWAVAVDINSDTNPQKSPRECDFPPGLIDAFMSVGWTWGGAFPTPDPMHWQWASGY